MNHTYKEESSVDGKNVSKQFSLRFIPRFVSRFWFLTLFELVFQFQSAKMSAFAVYNTPYAPQDLGLLENDQ